MTKFKPHNPQIAVLNALIALEIEKANAAILGFHQVSSNIRATIFVVSPTSYDEGERNDEECHVFDRDIEHAHYCLNEIKRHQDNAAELSRLKLRLHRDVDFDDGGAMIRLINKAKRLGTIPLVQ